MSDTARSSIRGYRGYIGCRTIAGHRVPQHVQNLVVRDYAARHGLAFRLSRVEYVMPGSFLMLESLLDELEQLDGVIVYSLFMLPSDGAARRRIWRRLLDAGRELHAAVEELAMRTEADAERLDLLLEVDRALRHAWRPASP
ncbi:MAG: LIC12192 family sporadic carbohydrate cluster protein [Acidobacteriota bacterium]